MINSELNLNSFTLVIYMINLFDESELNCVSIVNSVLERVIMQNEFNIGRIQLGYPFECLH